METIQCYRDLRVWKMGMDIAEQSYRLTKSFPRDEMFGMTSQIRRASSSIPANIAEGDGRQSRVGYVQFLKIAQGSLKELETHLLLSIRVELAAETVVTPLLTLCDHEGRMLMALIAKLGDNWVREGVADTYDTAEPYSA